MECWWYIAGLQWGINKTACRHRHGAWEPVPLPPPQLFCLLWHSVPRGYLDPHWGQLDGSQRVTDVAWPFSTFPGALLSREHRSTFLPVFLNGIMLLYFPANASFCPQNEVEVTSATASHALYWRLESLGVNSWSVSICCVGLHRIHSSYQPARGLYLLVLYLLLTCLHFLKFNFILYVCVNNFKLLSEQGRVEQKK